MPKQHYFDAVAKGDYPLTKRGRSEKRTPVGKVFGLRKYDLISTPQCVSFVKGKCSTGCFAIENILGEKVHASANVKKKIRFESWQEAQH